MGVGFTEFLLTVLIIVILTWTGLWPTVIKGLRELRGEQVQDEPRSAPPKRQGDAEFCYRMLGLSPSASWEDVERAYRRKAKVHHPDRGGDEDAMRTLNEAYQMLKRLHQMPRR